MADLETRSPGDSYVDEQGVLHHDAVESGVPAYVLPGFPPHLYEQVAIPTKIEAAWRASYQCGRAICNLLDTGQLLTPEDVWGIIVPLAQKAVEANTAVAKRDRACEKCIVGRLGYCSFATGKVGKGATAVTLTNRMASDLLGTVNMSTDETEEGKPRTTERPPLDDDLDVSVPDIMELTNRSIGKGITNPKARRLPALDSAREELAGGHFRRWEKEILTGGSTAIIATQLGAELKDGELSAPVLESV